MIEKIPSPIENNVSRIYDRINLLKNDPDELEKHISGAIEALGLEKGTFIQSSEITTKIVENIIKEINPKIELSRLDQKEIRDLRFIISNRNKSRNKKFYYTPAEIEAGEAGKKNIKQDVVKDESDISSGEGEVLVKEWGADKATKKFE